ncbi:expressed unknown protein [Seminavis robusta]|uniref:Uncharacterized protein n=1 Tax=Seminavis robusta TaxID=568900 RepID=A0A9N8E1H2_9STRA|nr:expressed unknown protein [Seminavis robusta]|eukprot:Sro411_g137740.1 n/a (747) ;mRNA; f:63674-65914
MSQVSHPISGRHQHKDRPPQTGQGPHRRHYVGSPKKKHSAPPEASAATATLEEGSVDRYNSRRVSVSIGGGCGGPSGRRSMAERGNSFSLPFDHGDVFARSPSSSLSEYELVGSSRRHEPLDPTAAALDAAILDLTRRRLAMSAPSGRQEPPGAVTVARETTWDRGVPYTTSANLAARQKHLQQQQKELEHKQRELEIQRQQLLAGMQEHAKSTSIFNAHQSAASMSSSQQQWWVCQVCHTKAFASHDEAMQHELTCCPEHHSFDSIEVVPIPSDSSLALPPLAAGYPVSPSLESSSLESPPAGPFTLLKEPIPLAMSSDKDWLTPLHCFVRRQCVEVFTASQSDVSTPSKGKRKPIQVGQVGIRCPHCHSGEAKNKPRERGSVYYPTTIASIYNATMNLLQRHLHSCSCVPASVMSRYETLKSDDARSGTSKRYWIESSLSLGLVDTPSGIRFSALPPPPLPGLSTQQHSTGSYSVERRNSNDFFSSNSNAVADLKGDADALPLDPPEDDEDDTGDGSISGTEQTLTESAPLVMPDDEPYSTKFSFHLISQMQPCVFTEADRLGKRKGLPPGFPGLACRHCFGGYGSGRFFPSSIKTLSDTSKTLNVLHNHMMRCRKCPQEVRDTLERLRKTHDDERSNMKFGSQKAFFAKVWARLHKSGSPELGKRKSAAAPPPPPPPGDYSPYAMAQPPMATQSYLDPRYFGPPITPPAAGHYGYSPHHDSFSMLDVLGSPLEAPDTKRRRST